MNRNPGTLFMVCGPICAGKSTMAQKLAQVPDGLYISEDGWLGSLYPEEIIDIPSMVDRSNRLRGVVGPVVVAMLKSGMSIALDFQANIRSSRAWMLDLAHRAGAPHELHWMDVPHAVCKARLKLRNEMGTHEFAPTEEQFDLIASYFQAPSEEEGVMVIRHV